MQRFSDSMRRGITIIELAIVIVIGVILVMIAVPNIFNARIRSKVARAKADIQTIKSALQAYYSDSHFPCDFDKRYGITEWAKLTTPTAYLTSIPRQPFFIGKRSSGSAAEPYPYV
ncbi:MAG: hypothetical protein NTX50_09070 [Candidatus Sumerlaeota bacterium]|nr:hypothetical protein [Candidatus Sumerlaeota bacterium]